MIVSYETLRTLQDELAGAPIGLLLADEGHRLKNAGKLWDSPAKAKLTFRHTYLPIPHRFECAKKSHPHWYTYPKRFIRILCPAQLRKPRIPRFQA
jgi:hypothetical protein